MKVSITLFTHVLQTIHGEVELKYKLILNFDVTFYE